MPRPALLRDDPGLTLALAIIVSSTVPLLMLDERKRIVATSASFCAAFDIDCTEVSGRLLSELGQGEWSSRQLDSLLDATLSGDANIEGYETDLRREGLPDRRLVLKVQKLDACGEPALARLLVAVSDVTDLRLREKRDLATRDKNVQLERDNHVLLQEIRHRVANSLQIIASVMMQNARRSQSEETRRHLRDAHNRVMSVAELEQQLAVSTSGAVKIRSYLTKLCATIGASMIADPDRLRLTVTEGEDVEVDPAVSVSLGLIVTELVINALKHAFPEDGQGTIVVAYEVAGEGWTLSVTDDGIGMPTAREPAVAGLGTSIVQALSRQLRADVLVSEAGPGARVCITVPAIDAEAKLQPLTVEG